MKTYLFIFSLFILAATGCNNSTVKTEEVANGNDAVNSTAPAVLPPFKLVDLNRKPVNLADFKGKKIFVNLWASWCPPCRAEIPSIGELYSKVDKTKVVFVMLSLDNEMETAIQFAAENKLTTPVYYPAENLPALFKTEGIPATFIFDEKGNLIKRIDGGDDYDTAEYLKLLSE